MRHFSPVLALCVLAASRSVQAQGADYVPAQRLPEGRELGGADIPAWVAAGAPIGEAEAKKPH